MSSKRFCISSGLSEGKLELNPPRKPAVGRNALPPKLGGDRPKEIADVGIGLDVALIRIPELDVVVGRPKKLGAVVVVVETG